MAWDKINASESDANSPLNQTLIDKVRLNQDEIMAGMVLINLGCHYDKSGFFSGPIDALRSTSGAWVLLAEDMRIVVPDGITQVNVQIYAKCDLTSANHYIAVEETNSSVDSADFPNLPSDFAWQPTQTLTVSSGINTLDIYGHSNSGSPTFGLRGILIWIGSV
jgi:hypothetical protein